MKSLLFVIIIGFYTNAYAFYNTIVLSVGNDPVYQSEEIDTRLKEKASEIKTNWESLRFNNTIHLRPSSLVVLNNTIDGEEVFTLEIEISNPTSTINHTLRSIDQQAYGDRLLVGLYKFSGERTKIKIQSRDYNYIQDLVKGINENRVTFTTNANRSIHQNPTSLKLNLIMIIDPTKIEVILTL